MNLLVMKRLYLVRHAKSSWKDLSITDFERPLNKRGEKDAPLMGKLLKDKRLKFDLILSSPAGRTKDTATFIAKEIEYKSNIIFDNGIYESSLKNLHLIIKHLNDKIMNVMLVGHNPELTMLVNYLSNDNIDNIPTCGVVALKFNGEWKYISSKSCEILFFEYPKKNW
jgi:phosphohistidine phosphatase